MALLTTMEGAAPTDETVHELRACYEKASLTEVRRFDYCTVHSWASFPRAWLLPCLATAEGQRRELSQSEDSSIYPCFGGPTVCFCHRRESWEHCSVCQNLLLPSLP